MITERIGYFWKKCIPLIGTIVAFELIGYLFGLLTQANIEPWYLGLEKSRLTPPGIVFSIVWSILYAILAIIGWSLFNRRHEIKFKQIYHLYVLQIIMNWAWTPLFFQFHWIGFSFIWLVVLACINGIILIKLRNQMRWIAILQFPYFLWLIFATYLNGMIWILN